MGNAAMRELTGDQLEPGAIIAHRYRIRGYRGDRGFGQVYEAEDSAMDRRVALMRLRREFSQEDARERFYDTRSTVTVEDPRIVDLCDYGEDVDGRLFLVMPWVDEAEALDERLARGDWRPDWAQQRALLEQIAGALAAAHAKGVLHGGLEPARVLIDSHDRVHIVDFGLAPALTQPPTGGREVSVSTALPGRIEYLSPEQIRSEPVDARSDIYALGVLAWELATGAPPFTGDVVQVADAHVHAPLPKLRSDAGWTPPQLEPLLRRALAKEPSARLNSVAEFLRLLAAMPAAAKPAAAKPAAAKPPAKPAAAPPPPPAPASAGEPAPLGPSAAAPATTLVSPSAPADAPEPAAEPPEPTPEPTPAPTPAPQVTAGVRALDLDPQPSPRRRLGKLELAVIGFLAFDLLLFGAWKLFGGGQAAQDEAAVAQHDHDEQGDDTPQPSAPEPAATAPAPAEPAAPAEPPPPVSVAEAIAAELPPEPDTPGPVRPMAKTLTEKALRQAMVEARDTTLRKCLDTRMRRTLKVAVKVAPSGKVEYARVVGSLGETALGQCVVKQVYKIEFPPTFEGGSHTYTLRLR